MRLVLGCDLYTGEYGTCVRQVEVCLLIGSGMLHVEFSGHGSFWFVNQTLPELIETWTLSVRSYDAMCMDKDGKRHVLRISQPGYETHWFGADTKDKADKWAEVRTSLRFQEAAKFCTGVLNFAEARPMERYSLRCKLSISLTSDRHWNWDPSDHLVTRGYSKSRSC